MTIVVWAAAVMFVVLVLSLATKTAVSIGQAAATGSRNLALWATTPWTSNGSFRSARADVAGNC